ncbi:MAG: glycine dehydrogenase (aminomethyl-transferring) [Ignavibacteria bacterium GWC2_36_12]|nr:MAG: glycine dehydrogenase (aminomethyl-transferring) [Ignavibacteria bacterium GWC2_36_12]
MKILEHPDKFVNRHIGPSDDEINEMLKSIGVKSPDQLISETIPENIRLNKKLNLDDPVTEFRFLENLKKIAAKNKVFKSYIGMGYYPTRVPAVIQRNILENPGWYTQYTPYQAEIAQGRLEALMNFQTMVIDLTGLPIANASLLDEGTAAAEAMSMFFHISKSKAHKFFVSDDCFPQTIDVMRTRAVPLGIELIVGKFSDVTLTDEYFGMLLQYPSDKGEVYDYKNLIESAHQKNIFTVVAADLLSLTLLTPPGEFGADVVIGNSQRFGVPMGYGGPHAAFFATKDEFKRNIPGRIIGASIDVHGNTAFRMALQTREQHIRREKATSNICTAQVLLAVMAGMYAVYHGPKGLREIGERTHKLAKLLDVSIKDFGFEQSNKNYFDTLYIPVKEKQLFNKIKGIALSQEINFRYFSERSAFGGNDAIGISVSEVTDFNDALEIIEVFAQSKNLKVNKEKIEKAALSLKVEYPGNLKRKSSFLQHKVFNSYHSETEMMRYLKRLENKDLSLVHSMIALGSCTMKLNAASEMIGVTFSEFSNIHPFAPVDQAAGYSIIFKELEMDLCEITGFSAVSLQPNSGAQGEYAGLMVIREYHKSRGETNRNVAIIPASAHGTNPASAVMAGMKVVVVNSTPSGNVDVADLKKKVEENKDNLAAFMITYPSTHGVFEESIIEICDIIHKNGGLVYMDGANMNAQVGLTSPAKIGADVCHLNLHKTFCIPHGGGGPGMGPIAVAKHLVPFLPNHSVVELGHENGITAVSSAPWGSPSILIISYAYIKMMGERGLSKASEVSILNANYIKAKLESQFKVLYTGKNGRVAHELIFDMRQFKASANIEVEDIAKRLMDYGYHAPTVSFPVAGTLMVEPTESESKTELDMFCEALLSIREEIREIENGTADVTDNLLKNSPHILEEVTKDSWNHPYSRQKAAYPLGNKQHKFWASVGRINSAYGDRNLVCSCNLITDYIEGAVSGEVAGNQRVVL